MFFNYDSFELGAIIFIVSGIFIYSFCNSSPSINNESLVNTKSLSNLDSNIQLDKLPNQSYVEASVQTVNIDASLEAAATHVNTGMQTSPRMWLEYINNWINELLSSPTQAGKYVDVGVQVDTSKSTWETVKQWFFEVCSVRSTDLSSMGYNKVDKWRNKLDSIQSVDIHNSDSSLTTLKFGSDSSLQNLVDPNDSASNVSEVVSESSLQNLESSTRVYDMNNTKDVLELMNNPTVVFGINSAYDPADDIITFYTSDASYEIFRSTLEALLTSVN